MDVAGDAGDADDVFMFVADGCFVGEAPAVFAVGVEVELEAGVDAGAAVDDGEVLGAEGLAEFGGEEVDGFFPDDLFF